jgi:hypothetical protein
VSAKLSCLIASLICALVCACAGTAPTKAPPKDIALVLSAGGAPSDLPPDVQALMNALQGPTPESTESWLTFSDLHEAAVVNAQRLEECSRYYECDGLIVVKPNGKYALAPLRTDFQSDHTRPDTRSVPLGWVIAADEHSHPCLPDYVTSVFSPTDMIGYLISDQIGFMVDLCTGDVHEFLPGKTKVNETQVAPGIWLSGGKVIGNVGPAKPTLTEGITR